MMIKKKCYILLLGYLKNDWSPWRNHMSLYQGPCSESGIVLRNPSKHWNHREWELITALGHQITEWSLLISVQIRVSLSKTKNVLEEKFWDMIQIYSTNISREWVSNMISDLPETQIPPFLKGAIAPLFRFTWATLAAVQGCQLCEHWK